MSRLAKKPIILPKQVELKIINEEVHAKGPKGTLLLKLMKGINVKLENETVVVTKDEDLNNSFYGLYLALLRNVVIGVSEGFEKRLNLVGVGYRAAIKGSKLALQVGYSHPTEFEIPKELQIKIEEKGTEIIISGPDKQFVGQFAALIRAIKPPEPYQKCKGIRYKNEYIRKKAGKTAKTAAAGA